MAPSRGGCVLAVSGRVRPGHEGRPVCVPVACASLRNSQLCWHLTRKGCDVEASCQSRHISTGGWASGVRRGRGSGILKSTPPHGASDEAQSSLPGLPSNQLHAPTSVVLTTVTPTTRGMSNGAVAGQAAAALRGTKGHGDEHTACSMRTDEQTSLGSCVT